MQNKKIDKQYVSDIDKVLTEFDRKHAKSESQQAEIDKYERITKLRDHAIPTQKDKDLFDFE